MKFSYTGVYNGRTEFGSVECATMEDALSKLAKNGVVVGHLYDEDDVCVYEVEALHSGHRAAFDGEMQEQHITWIHSYGQNGSRCDLHGADLRGANLRQAILQLADLSGADLSGADLSGAILYKADLSGAILSGAKLSWANLRKANLMGASLRKANLSGAYMRGANLKGADFRGANLGGAELSLFGFFVAIRRWFPYSKASGC